MPISSNESWRQSPSLNEKSPGNNKPGGAQNETEETVSDRPLNPGGLRIPFGELVLQIEPRFFIILVLIFPLYTVAAFVGNDWAYMLPCTLLAALVLGVLFPLLEVSSISCTCRVPPKSNAKSDQELILKAWRLPFFGVLSKLIPSGYLNAKLHLLRRSWKGAKKVPAIVPLPVVLSSLSQGVELRLRVPSLARGVYEAETLEISTCFPFAIAWWSRHIKLHTEKHESSITVLPVLKEMVGNFHGRLSSTSINTGRTQKNWTNQHRSTTLKGLREFTERDSLNQIHWASSAKTGKLMVREFEVESLPDFDVLLNLEYKWTESQFELACSAAFALVHYGYRSGFSPQLRLHPPLDWEITSELLADIPAGLSGEELVAETLARVSPLPPGVCEAYKKHALERKQSSIILDSDIVINSRTMISIAPSSRERSSKSIILVELQNDADISLAFSATSQAVSLAQLESDAELSRL